MRTAADSAEIRWLLALLDVALSWPEPISEWDVAALDVSSPFICDRFFGAHFGGSADLVDWDFYSFGIRMGAARERGEIGGNRAARRKRQIASRRRR